MNHVGIEVKYHMLSIEFQKAFYTPINDFDNFSKNKKNLTNDWMNSSGAKCGIVCTVSDRNEFYFSDILSKVQGIEFP